MMGSVHYPMYYKKKFIQFAFLPVKALFYSAMPLLVGNSPLAL